MEIVKIHDSSVISELGYSYKYSRLYIRFVNGRKRFYRDVPSYHVYDMIQAMSIGEYYNLRIKGEYQSVPCLVDVRSN